MHNFEKIFSGCSPAWGRIPESFLYAPQPSCGAVRTRSRSSRPQSGKALAKRPEWGGGALPRVSAC